MKSNALVQCRLCSREFRVCRSTRAGCSHLTVHIVRDVVGLGPVCADCSEHISRCENPGCRTDQFCDVKLQGIVVYGQHGVVPVFIRRHKNPATNSAACRPPEEIV